MPQPAFQRCGKLPFWLLLGLMMVGFLAGAGVASAQLMSVGNLIFVDANGNGHADSGEGVEGVMVQLWKVSGDPEFPYDLQDTTLSAPNGFYSFQDLTPGTYKVTVPASEFAVGKPLQGMYCLPIAQLVGDDDTGARGQYDFSPDLNGISTMDFIVLAGFGPEGIGESGFAGDFDDADDANGDMTVDLGFYRPLGIGNLVFVDTNHNDRADPGEGIAGVDVQLYRATDTPGQDFALLDLATDDTGHFLFGGLAAGDYKLYIGPSQFQQGGPLEGALSITGVGPAGKDDDDSEDGIDDLEPQTNGILSRTITLVAGGSPIEGTGETGSNAADDDSADADVDLTVDFGFTLPFGKVGVGNLVFIDADHNGKYDDGEGVAGVMVKLFAAGANPLADAPVAIIQTASDGSYLFSNIDPGNYFLFVPPSEFALGKPLFSALSVAGTQSGDDESGEDGIDVPTPELSGVATAEFALAEGTAPTNGTTELGYAAGSDNFHDADVDLTHDFGFVLRSVNPMSVGNLVFFDANHSGGFDTGEGVGGVLVQLFREGDDISSATPVASQLTENDGNYFFTGLVPGNYFVHIAASAFEVGQPLEGLLSMTGNGIDNQADDDVNENGVDASTPSDTGISSGMFTLAEGTEPVEAGFRADEDDALDTNGDLTIDLGFRGACPTMTVTPGTLADGTAGTGYGPISFSVIGANSTVAWDVSGGTLPDGVSLSPSGELSGTPTHAGDFTFTIRAATGDGCEASQVFSVVVAPASGTVGVGNAIYIDANNDGIRDFDEGVNGVVVQLFQEGDDAQTASPLAFMSTSSGGHYRFDGLAPGRYFIHVPASEFATSKPLKDRVSAPGVSQDDGVDDNVPGNDHGIDAADPAITGVSSVVFELAAGMEPVNAPSGSETGLGADEDDVADSNVDLTIDLAFVLSPQVSMGVGNVVFKDLNGNGHYDSGEGVDGVYVFLYKVGPFEPNRIAMTQTADGGRYSFTGLEAGQYFVQVWRSAFQPGGPLAGLLSIPGAGTGDDDLDEDGIDNDNPQTSSIASRVFTLDVGSAPTDAGIEHGVGAADDNGLDANFDATIDFGFYDPAQPVIGVGNLVYIDADENGQFDTGEGTAGVTVQLFADGEDPLTATPVDVTRTGTDGTYLLTTNVAGDYFVFIPPSQFGNGMPLYNYTSLTGNGPDNTADLDDNGVDSAEPAVTGIRTVVLHLQAGTEPTEATAEIGYNADSDDANDANFDLTMDFGFGLACPVFVITPSTLPDGAMGISYNVTFSATGGTGPYTWGVTAGALPLGVELRTIGSLTGAPAVEGTFNVTVTATDSNGCEGSASYQILIGSPPTVGLGNAIYVDANHNGIMDSGEGADGVVVKLFNQGDDPLTATAVQTTLTTSGAYAFEGLPMGGYFVYVPASEFAIGKPLHGLISIPGVTGDDGVDDSVVGNDNGIDAANPEVTGVASVVVSLQAGTEPENDTAAANTPNANFDSTVDLGFQTPCPTLMITPGSLPPATVAYAYNQTLEASGGTGPVVFSIVDGGLPDGVTLSEGGQLSGSTFTKGSFPLTIRATNVDGCHIDWATAFVVNGQLAVGNLVFFDKNGNGHADTGEGVNGVTVELYHGTDTPESVSPIATATTSNGGLYLIDTLPPGNYLLHLPKAMFASGAPLWKMQSVAGVVGTGDDDAGEAGEDAVDPSLTGISTAAFTLAAGTAPTSLESGLGGSSDDTRDADVDLTKDFGLVDIAALPATFSDWATDKGLNGPNAGPSGNPDHDAYGNLLEYALGLDPGKGGEDASASFVVKSNPGTGKMELKLRRRHGGQGDLTYQLQVLAALNGSSWTTSSVTPVVVNNGDGTETVTYGSLDDDPALVGSNYGFVRVLVALDTNSDGTPDATETSPIMGWQRRLLAVQNQTYSVPYVASPVFTGTPDAVNGNTLDITTSLGGSSFLPLIADGRAYYVEVTSGVNVGQRWEIDEAGSTATGILLLPADERSTQPTVPVSLQGDLIAVRPHWRVMDLFPPAEYHATNSASTADQILVWDQTMSGYVTFWLANYFGQSHWHEVGVAALNDTRDSRVIGPCEGLFARPKLGSVNASGIGQLRTWPMACPLKQGTNFIGNPFPVAQSPANRSMNVASGFTGDPNPVNSDRIYFWVGDTSNTTGYTTYHLLKQGSREIWKIVGSTDLITNYGTQNLFSPGSAAFINSIHGKADWVIPAPTLP